MEADFNRLGWAVAKDCYRRAVRALVEGRFEDANSGIRSMFESALVAAATIKAFVSSKQGGSGQAINFLKAQNLLADRDGGWFIHGLWLITHTNGQGGVVQEICPC
ncbi:hypothetical protein OG535_05185 [Kitasatospora sp. NBC_00085]|uniref:hypothetical protein n=1 Tax=unclassified Kitasatospora TaxID=2633591 RepID=UPI003244E913